MKLNKKYFLAIFTALGIQFAFGFSFVYAMPCEKEFANAYTNDTNSGPYYSYFGDYRDFKKNYDGINSLPFNEYVKANVEVAIEIGDLGPGPFSPTYSGKTCVDRHSSIATLVSDNLPKVNPEKYITHFTSHYGDRVIACVSNYLSQNSCDISAFTGAGAGKQSNSKSNQSSAAAQSNSPESYNIQVSQTNKQNYQAVQRAYEQANAGKGKKNNLQAVGTECMKNNPSQKSFTNKCNQAINFAYCFSGIVPGYKNEHPETLAEMSCQNGQFGTLTLGAGESIPGSYRGMVLEGVGCKSPSQPVGMKYNTSEPANGRCSY